MCLKRVVVRDRDGQYLRENYLGNSPNWDYLTSCASDVSVDSLFTLLYISLCI